MFFRKTKALERIADEIEKSNEMQAITIEILNKFPTASNLALSAFSISTAIDGVGNSISRNHGEISIKEAIADLTTCIRSKKDKEVTRHSCAMPVPMAIQLTDDYPDWERSGQAATLLAFDFDGKTQCRAWVKYEDGTLGYVTKELFKFVD